MKPRGALVVAWICGEAFGDLVATWVPVALRVAAQAFSAAVLYVLLTILHRLRKQRDEARGDRDALRVERVSYADTVRTGPPTVVARTGEAVATVASGVRARATVAARTGT